ncbi:hypothetical protein TI03_04460 [Achromatium sp. WMS1]|nr:hypothetical protein TI03_04460 [Achromatium sp. WMS1]
MLANKVGWPTLGTSLIQEVLLRGSHTNYERYLLHLATYPFQIILATIPFSLLLLPLVTSRLFRQSLLARHGSLALFAITAVLVNLPLYWFKGRSPVRYFLPMLPFLLLLATLSYETLLATATSAGHLNKQQWYLLNFSTKGNYSHLLLPIFVSLMLLLRMLEFGIYMPYKAQYLAATQNASASYADPLPPLLADRPLFVSRHIPSAIWFYAPRNLIRLLTSSPDALRNGDILLRHQVDYVKDMATTELAKYRYEDNELRLNVLHIRSRHN